MNSHRLKVSIITATLAGSALIACSGDPEPTRDATSQTSAAVTIVTFDASGARASSCAGTLLDRDTVLTAAHCVATGARWTVTASADGAIANGVRAMTYDWAGRPTTKARPKNSDIAVLTLDRPFLRAVYPTLSFDDLASGTAVVRVRRDGQSMGTAQATAFQAAGKGFPNSYFMEMPAGEVVDTGGALIDPATNRIYGVISGRGRTTGLLFASRLSRVATWTQEASTCGAPTPTLRPMSTPASTSVTTENGFRVTFVGSKTRPDGSSEWTYRVEELPGSQDLSHWVIGVPNCPIVSGAPKGEVVRPDPTTHVGGVKWEPGDGFKDGTFTIVVGPGATQGTVEFGVKGPGVAVGTIAGPVCNGGGGTTSGGTTTGGATTGGTTGTTGGTTGGTTSGGGSETCTDVPGTCFGDCPGAGSGGGTTSGTTTGGTTGTTTGGTGTSTTGGTGTTTAGGGTTTTGGGTTTTGGSTTDGSGGGTTGTTTSGTGTSTTGGGDGGTTTGGTTPGGGCVGAECGGCDEGTTTCTDDVIDYGDCTMCSGGSSTPIY